MLKQVLSVFIYLELLLFHFHFLKESFAGYTSLDWWMFFFRHSEYATPLPFRLPLLLMKSQLWILWGLLYMWQVVSLAVFTCFSLSFIVFWHFYYDVSGCDSFYIYHTWSFWVSWVYKLIFFIKLRNFQALFLLFSSMPFSLSSPFGITIHYAYIHILSDTFFFS